MQFNIIIFSIILVYEIILISISNCAPTDLINLETDVTLESTNAQQTVSSIHGGQDLTTTSHSNERKKLDYYEYRHTVAEGVQKALDQCREKFKWERWNCPKKAFLDILDKNALPSNKEFALTRALIASGIVLSLTRSCSFATNNVCGCGMTTTATEPNLDFMWRGCDENIKFAFKVSKIYLESQDDEASRLINAHNYEVGRLAVKKNMVKVCKCHGVSGACQVKTCWLTVPDMSKVGSYIKRQYRLAAKVGANSVAQTNITTLTKELLNINQEKLVFAEPSPDYCYENTKLGINGTLGRYCSMAKHHPDGNLVSRSERDSCDRLCTRCGYKIQRERLNVEKQCDCRFVYCCSVECKRCPDVEETYKCVRHS